MFTGEAGAWWPLASHSVYDEDAAGLTMDARAGGEIVETGPGGERVVWGTFLRVEPPEVLVFSWHPGWGADQATEVEVRFSPDPAAAQTAWSWRPPPWPWRPPSSPCAGPSSGWSTAASTGAATTPPAPSTPSPGACASRSTWPPCAAG